MPRCRVFLFTYKRNTLVGRAVESLLAQTFTDWVCEVHDDDPENHFVKDYITQLNDNRFIVKQHSKNLGAVQSFNLAFTSNTEAFSSILEDDNWWEPAFLQTAIDYLDQHPDASMVWSNMRLWQEKMGGQWEDTHQTTWDCTTDQMFYWPQQKQIIGHLHSTGAMVYRNNGSGNNQVPKGTLLNAVEAVRERSFKHPIAVLAKPLANFAITLSTNRSADKTEWIATQVMLLASYVLTAPNKYEAFDTALAHHRMLKPSPIANFYLANAWIIKDEQLKGCFTIKDRLFLFKWLIKNAIFLGKIKGYIKNNQQVYNYLLEQTGTRFKQSRQQF
jgi:glycosyltransferase involved in cell wall biosynthesis